MEIPHQQITWLFRIHALITVTLARCKQRVSTVDVWHNSFIKVKLAIFWNMQSIRCKWSGPFFFFHLSGTWLIKQHAETQQRHVCWSLGIKQNLKRPPKTMNSSPLTAPRVWMDVLCAFYFEYFGFRSTSQPPTLPLLFIQPFKSDPNIPTLV